MAGGETNSTTGGSDAPLPSRRFATNAVHAGTQHVGDAVNTPIFQSSTYKLTDERYAGWAAGAQHTLLYSRISSVNSDAVAQKLRAMEGGEDAEIFASGMGAISSVFLGLLNAGDHIVASPDIYGGTYGLLNSELTRFGVEVTLADMRDPASYEAAIQPNTKMLYIETLTNPVLKVCDIPAMVEVAKRHNLLTVIDSTFASPWGCNPLNYGVDLVIHSTTKYLGGHSDIIGGAVVGRADLIAKVFMQKVHFGASLTLMHATFSSVECVHCTCACRSSAATLRPSLRALNSTPPSSGCTTPRSRAIPTMRWPSACCPRDQAWSPSWSREAMLQPCVSCGS